MNDTMTPPPGFEPWARSSPFLDLVGPVYHGADEETFSLGLFVDERHANSRGLVHGGLMSSVADVCLGYGAALSTDPPTRLATVHLSIDLLGAPKLGDWLEFRVLNAKLGSRLAFADGDVRTSGGIVARTSGIFAVQTERDR